jgi:hypothetical protein
MAKSRPGLWFHCISLINMVVVINHKQQLKSMQTYMKSLISINVGIAFKHSLDVTQLFNTPIVRENFTMLSLRTNRVLP